MIRFLSKITDAFEELLPTGWDRQWARKATTAFLGLTVWFALFLMLSLFYAVKVLVELVA